MHTKTFWIDVSAHIYRRLHQDMYLRFAFWIFELIKF